MKTSALVFIILLLAVACNSDKQEKTSKAGDTLLPSQTKVTPVDTTIEYSIEGISTEGSSAFASYNNGKIKKCVINIYGETGQVEIHYVFKDNKIDVSEKELSYKVRLENVKSDKDIIFKKEITYAMDIKGNVIGKGGKDRTDIFTEFMKIVPLEIK